MPAASKTSEQATAYRKPDSAIRYHGAHVTLWTTAILALAADLWSKHWAFSTLSHDESQLGLFGLVTYQRSLNDGALFGMGKGLVPLFIVASILAVVFILYFFACSHRKQRVLHIALGFVLAGALGNMFDRTFMRADRLIFTDETGRAESVLGAIVGDPHADPIQVGAWPDGSCPQTYDRRDLAEPPRSLGVVRDFIKFQPVAGRDIWPWIFNIADALLVVGVGLLFIGFAFERRQMARE